MGDWIFEWWPEGRTGTYVALLLTAVSLWVWHRLMKRVQRHAVEEFSVTRLLLQAANIPAIMVITASGLRVALGSWPENMALGPWIKLVDLISLFGLLLLLGELLFALGVDYWLKHRHGTEIPSIFNQLVKSILYLIVGLSLVSTTWRVDITPLLTTSAVFTMVIGLALQDVLGSLFAGLAVHISPPFRIGDWINTGTQRGKVVESNWRAITLRTLDNQYITIPNNDVAKKELVNLTPPSGRYGQNLIVGIDYDVSPTLVEEVLLKACAGLEKVLRRPTPKVFLEAFDDFSMRYRVRYWIDDYAHAGDIASELNTRVWFGLRRHHCHIPCPVREIIQRPPQKGQREVIRARLRLLDRVDFLAGVNREARVYLAKHAEVKEFEKGEKVCVQGTAGDEFYIVVSGEVGVFLRDQSTDHQIATLGAGEFFGEMSLLTGEPRSATIRALRDTSLLSVSKAMLQPLLVAHQELAEPISQALASRRQAIDAKQKEAADAVSDPRSLPSTDEGTAVRQGRLLSAIRSFFGL